MGNVGRPKLLNPQTKRFEMRLTDSEFKKIENISKKLKISKREAILRGIDLLITNKPKIYRSQLHKNNPVKQNAPGIVED